jgi:A/G-specific adenine glycosylase
MTNFGSPVALQQFQDFLLRWYQLYGRHSLPWRQTTDPYAILVSELMLQQTQVVRVIPKYFVFLKLFPDLKTLRAAKLEAVLSAWQGLGYNRRARYLWQLAQETLTLPRDPEQLKTLPGIGPYTVGAVAAFAFNIPVTLIETNVRTVFLYHFFPEKTAVSDAELLPLIAATVPIDKARIWYAALMDYGSYLKSVLPNPSRQSKHHNKQSQFQGSVRQVRGELVRLLLKAPATKTALLSQLTGNTGHFESALTQLLKDKMIREENHYYRIA